MDRGDVNSAQAANLPLAPAAYSRPMNTRPWSPPADLQPATIDDAVILIRIPALYRPGMSDTELYEATRAAWVIGARRDCADYAFAVVQGVVVEVYAIDGWQPAGTSRYSVRPQVEVDRPGRWEFEGRVAPEPIRDKYRWRTVKHHFRQGAQNPIRYVNC